MSASIFCSAISRRAFSSRPRRSSAVIGLAWLRIDVSAAMLGGSGPAGAAAAASALRGQPSDRTARRPRS